jgi:hypothetical protein
MVLLLLRHVSVARTAWRTPLLRVLSRVGGTREENNGFWIGWLDLLLPLYSYTSNYNQYSAIADLHTSQFIAVQALGFSVSTCRCLVADLNTGTITSNHYEVSVLIFTQLIFLDWYSYKRTRVIQPPHGPTQGKHSVLYCSVTPLFGLPHDRHPGSPMARWLLPNAGHIENTSHDRYPLLWCDVIAHVPATRIQRKHCCCIVGCVCVAGVTYEWIYMSQYFEQTDY